ncbi:acetate/propionate family kinase [Spirochaetota bacterium]
MKVLVINCGSSSLKYELIDLNDEITLWAGKVTRIGIDDTTHSYGVKEMKKKKVKADDQLSALKIVLDTLVGEKDVPIKNFSEIDAVSHRVGLGGTNYLSAAVIDDDVKNEIRRYIPVLPLHHPGMLAGIEACQEIMPDVPHVAVFDTSFHSTIPEEASIYGLPYELYNEKSIRKFGYHGNSHEFVASAAAEFLETPLKRLNIITCHLGNGASMCAVRRGLSIDTSMGFSPLQGLIMGTRVGDLDPCIIPYLHQHEGMSIDEIDEMMNKKGGLLGISGVSSDMREILEAAEKGNNRALLAIKTFCYRVKHYIGAYTAAMGDVDVLVFTGGIGENSRGIRARCVQGLEKLGIAMDPLKNSRCKVDDEKSVFDLTARHSRVNILAVATNEELMMARQCAKALDFKKSLKGDMMSTNPLPIRVAVSAHHVHLCREDVDALFGKGYQLTEKARLFIDSQFACNERVNLIGPRGTVEKVRILGPERSKTQIEISRTEEFKLGIDAPIRASGDLEGSPGIVLEGPKGRIDIPEGVICAMRHIHMTPEDAKNYGVEDKDIVMVKMEGERELIFGDVLVRVNPKYKLEMHIDTDEANAAELSSVSQGYIVMIESRDSC